MALDEPGEEDETVQSNGIDFVYNKNGKDLFNHTFIDYKETWYGEAFVICSPASEPCE